LDQLSGGRLAVHIIAGGSDAEQAKDGDWTDHDARYRRVAEYLTLLRRTWTEPAPFDHSGEFYRTRGTYSEIRCRQVPHIPIYGGGGSDAAIRSLAPHVDVYMLWGEPLRDTALFMDRVRQEAALHGRNPAFSLSTRPILGASEGEAWDRARAILDRVLSNRGGAPAPQRQNAGSNRLLRAAAEAELHDTCLWTSLAVATGAQGNSTALVGTPETVAQAMFEYYKLGATSLLIRGYDPRPDAIQYGEELIPRVRALVADHDAASGAAPAPRPQG
jgi:alkanesulfonate monooxygenase